MMVVNLRLLVSTSYKMRHQETLKLVVAKRRMVSENQHSGYEKLVMYH